MTGKRINFKNVYGDELSAIIDFPISQEPIAFAVFAHVFEESENIPAYQFISRALTLNGIAVLRLDFAGLGERKSESSETIFTSNVKDIIGACEYLKENHLPPSIIIGHSLGGAASIFAASQVSCIKAVAVISTPSESKYINQLVDDNPKVIDQPDKVRVNIAGRHFTIRKQFLDDLENLDMFPIIKNLKKALLILHSPHDKIVGIDNAAKIYQAAFHPKSFITLDNSDHMLHNEKDACYAGNVIASWAKRYIDIPEKEELTTHREVIAKLGQEGYTTDIMAGRHGMIADEPEDKGGLNLGPSPYELMNAALGACTAMTLHMYARRKKWPLQDVKVHLSFSRSYRDDCANCDKKDRRLEVFEREIEITGDLSETQVNRLMEIANKCPVHRTLENSATINTRLLVHNK